MPMSIPITALDGGLGVWRSTTKVAYHCLSHRFKVMPVQSLGNAAMASFARLYSKMGTRTGFPASNVEILSQKSNVGVLEGSMTTTLALAWIQIFRRIGGC